MTLLRRLDPWAWPLLLMASIFVLSAQPHLNSGLGVIDLIGRKVIHFGQNALLCFLWWRVLVRRMSARAAALAALAIASAYAVTDEYHQTFVAGRHGSPIDWAIDTAGAALAAWLLARRRVRSEARG